MSVTREAELALLIAEQEADDQSKTVWSANVSLDKQLGHDTDAGTLHEIVGTDFFGEGVGTTHDEANGDSTAPSDRDIIYWKYLHHKHKWTKKRIAEHAGLSPKQIARWLTKRARRGDDTAIAFLESRFDVSVAAYERGARLIDIGADLYAEAGFASPASCYQALRLIFHDRNVKLRTSNWKHGRATQRAGRAVYLAYHREHNAQVSARRRATLTRCIGKTNEGRRCSRWAREGPRCNVHAGLTGGPKKWTREAIFAAFETWETAHGRLPNAKEWARATVDHPTFQTCVAMFGSWKQSKQEYLTACDTMARHPGLVRPKAARPVI